MTAPRTAQPDAEPDTADGQATPPIPAPAALESVVPASVRGRAAHYRVPPQGAPARIAFVGQETYFHAAAQTHTTKAIAPTFIDFRAGADPNELKEDLAAAHPHAAIFFKPETIPAGLLHDLPAPTIGFLTEPLPRPGTRKPHRDLKTRLKALKALDPANFDRIVSFDPHIAKTVEKVAPVWRSLPLPVDDRYFTPVNDTARPPRIVFVGRSTPHRERFLLPVKHEWDILHIAHGVHGERLQQLLGETDAAINLHNEPYPTFENRVPLHLAAGNLVVSEPLSPTHGLEPGIDFIEVATPQDLQTIVHDLHEHPDLHLRVRRRGRRKAEAFRASTVYPRLIHDLLLDLAAFATPRPTPPALQADHPAAER